jgi:hypothetical protein
VQGYYRDPQGSSFTLPLLASDAVKHAHEWHYRNHSGNEAATKGFAFFNSVAESRSVLVFYYFCLVKSYWIPEKYHAFLLIPTSPTLFSSDSITFHEYTLLCCLGCQTRCL